MCYFKEKAIIYFIAFLVSYKLYLPSELLLSTPNNCHSENTTLVHYTF